MKQQMHSYYTCILNSPENYNPFTNKAKRVEWDPDGVSQPSQEANLYIIDPQHVVRIPVED